MQIAIAISNIAFKENRLQIRQELQRSIGKFSALMDFRKPPSIFEIHPLKRAFEKSARFPQLPHLGLTSENWNRGSVGPGLCPFIQPWGEFLRARRDRDRIPNCFAFTSTKFYLRSY